MTTPAIHKLREYYAKTSKHPFGVWGELTDLYTSCGGVRLHVPQAWKDQQIFWQAYNFHGNGD